MHKAGASIRRRRRRFMPWFMQCRIHLRMSSRHVIGMDIGGSSARLGLVDTESARIVAREVIPTGYDAQGPATMAAFRSAIGRLVSKGQPQALGVGMPGLQDDEGRVKDASNLP